MLTTLRVVFPSVVELDVQDIDTARLDVVSELAQQLDCLCVQRLWPAHSCSPFVIVALSSSSGGVSLPCWAARRSWSEGGELEARTRLSCGGSELVVRRVIGATRSIDRSFLYRQIAMNTSIGAPNAQTASVWNPVDASQ